MPKIKPTTVSAAADTVRLNIEVRAAEFNCRTDGQIADKIHMKRSTYSEHKRNPRTWTLEQLTLASIALNCTLGWLVTDHSKEIRGDSA